MTIIIYMIYIGKIDYLIPNWRNLFHIPSIAF